MTNSFTNGIGNSLKGMFGGLGNFGDEKSTRDVMVQTDLGGGKTFELYFPKMYVDYFHQSFSTEIGEGSFELMLKQTVFNEDNNTLK